MSLPNVEYGQPSHTATGDLHELPHDVHIQIDQQGAETDIAVRHGMPPQTVGNVALHGPVIDIVNRPLEYEQTPVEAS